MVQAVRVRPNPNRPICLVNASNPICLPIVTSWRPQSTVPSSMYRTVPMLHHAKTSLNINLVMEVIPKNKQSWQSNFRRNLDQNNCSSFLGILWKLSVPTKEIDSWELRRWVRICYFQQAPAVFLRWWQQVRKTEWVQRHACCTLMLTGNDAHG